MIQRIIAIWRKEFTEALRDRRSLTAAITFAVAGPLLVAGVIAMTAEKRSSVQPFAVAVEGRSAAPDLVAYLGRNDVDVVAPDGEAEVRLLIPEDYPERFRQGRTVTLQVVADRSRTAARRDARRLETVIGTYASELGQLRLMLRGVSPAVVRPVVVDGKDSASDEARASTVLGLLGVYFLLAAFVGSMAVAIDSSAGERERNSLEVLMAQPVRPLAVFLGKWLNTLVFGAFGVALALVASRLAFSYVPLAKIGISWSLEWSTLAVMLLALVPLAAFAAAVQLGLAMWAKTFKEASAYLNMLSFVPAVVAFVVVIQELEPARWMFAVPVLGHQQLLNTLMRADPLGATEMVLLVVSTLALTAAIIAAGARMLTRERIVFGQLD